MDGGVTNRSPDTSPSPKSPPCSGFRARLVPGQEGSAPAPLPQEVPARSLKSQAGQPARKGPLQPHLIWRYCFFHPIFEAFSSSSQKAALGAGMQPGGCSQRGRGSLLVSARMCPAHNSIIP